VRRIRRKLFFRFGDFAARLAPNVPGFLRALCCLLKHKSKYLDRAQDKQNKIEIKNKQNLRRLPGNDAKNLMGIKFIPQVHSVNEDVANTGRTQGGRDFVIFVIFD